METTKKVVFSIARKPYNVFSFRNRFKITNLHRLTGGGSVRMLWNPSSLGTIADNVVVTPKTRLHDKAVIHDALTLLLSCLIPTDHTL